MKGGFFLTFVQVLVGCALFFRKRDATMRYVLFGTLIEEDMNSVFRNLKRISDGIGDVLNELLLLLRGSPGKQTDLDSGHLVLLLKFES